MGVEFLVQIDSQKVGTTVKRFRDETFLEEVVDNVLGEDDSLFLKFTVGNRNYNLDNCTLVRPRIIRCSVFFFSLQGGGPCSPR